MTPESDCFASFLKAFHDYQRATTNMEVKVRADINAPLLR